MGWWSKDVLGGDTPLDMMWAFEDAIGTGMGSLYPLENWPKKIRTKVKTYIENNKSEFWEAIRHAETMAGFEGTEVALQVAAVIWLNAGAYMDELHKSVFIKAARNDAWAKEDKSRKAVMDNLIETIKCYTEMNPVTVSSEGLFEVVDKKIFHYESSAATPKEVIKDLLRGVNKDAQKHIFRELLEELENETY